MNLIKPSFWDKKIGFLSLVLYPITIIYILVIFFKRKFSKVQKFKIPIICVGNIYLGGTGKTTLSIKIYNLLKERGLKVCFIKKFYSNQEDERNLLSMKGFLISKKTRKEALLEAIKRGFKIAIFDDGLQDKTVEYDKKIVCFNNKNWIGNGKTIPSGPLREDINSIRKYDYVFLNGNLENLKLSNLPIALSTEFLLRGLLLSFLSTTSAAFIAAALPKTTKSIKLLEPRRLAPCTEAHPASPTAIKPGRILF